MAGPAAILGTTSSHGGSMVTATGTLFQTPEGAVCIQGDSHQCPIRGHGTTPIVSGCATVSFTNGSPIAIDGSVAGCGAVLNGNFATKTLLT